MSEPNDRRVLYLWLALRAYVMVALVACNTIQVAHGRWLGAFCVGALISILWYWNAGTAGKSDLPRLPASLCYGLGAGLGTLTGMWLAGV